MGFRRTIVKLLNLVYVAAAGVAIYSICTRNIVNINLQVNMSSEQVGKFIGTAFNKKSEVREREYTYTRADEAKISDWLTQESLEEAFPNGLHASAVVQVPFAKAFEFNNPNLIKELVVDNLQKIIDDSLDTVSDALYVLFKKAAEHYAIAILEDQINETLEELFPGDNETGVSSEDVQEIFDNVYDLIEQEEATVDDVATAILGEDENSAGLLKILNDKANENGEFFEAYPTSEEIAEDLQKEQKDRKYFIYNGETFVPNNAAYDATQTYYIFRTFSKVNVTSEDVEYELAKAEEDRQLFVREDGHFLPVYESYKDYVVASNVDAEAIATELDKEEAKRTIYIYNGSEYVVVSEAYDASTEYFVKNYYYEEYDASKINAEAIAQAMVDELESVPGLVTKTGEYIECSPSESQVNADLEKPENERVYFVKDGENYVPNNEAYVDGRQYYKEKVIINDVQSALATLLEEMLNGGSTNSGSNESRLALRSRAEAVETSEETSQSDLRKVLAEFVEKYIPFAAIDGASAKIGSNAAYILAGVVAIFAAPWIWFAFITLIRTLRKKKCWTRTAIVFVWAIPQVILGIVLTYGLKYGLQIAADKIEMLKSVADMINLDIRFSCLIPSFIYLGMIPFTIVYWIVSHPVKTEYKLERTLDRREREREIRERRRQR